jgi:hypothetical protein
MRWARPFGRGSLDRMWWRYGHPGQAGVRRFFIYQTLVVMPRLVRGIHDWTGNDACGRSRVFRQIFPYGDLGRLESA